MFFQGSSLWGKDRAIPVNRIIPSDLVFHVLTYLLTCLLTFFLTWRERERERRNGWFEPRANILPYTFSSKIFTKDESRPGKSLLGDARILRVSTEPGEYSKWPSESQNPTNKGRSPRTFEKPRASSASLFRFSSSFPLLPLSSFHLLKA